MGFYSTQHSHPEVSYFAFCCCDENTEQTQLEGKGLFSLQVTIGQVTNNVKRNNSPSWGKMIGLASGLASLPSL